MLKSLLLSFTLAGTFVGAGFATGQEMVSFFIMKNPDNPFFFVLSCLFLFFPLKLLKNITNNEDAHSLYLKLFGKVLGKAMSVISAVSLFICYGASAAGMGSIFFEAFSLPYLLGAGILVIISLIAATKGIKGINILNSLLTPIIIISIPILGLYAALTPSYELISFNKSLDSPVLFSLLYAGYNIFPLIPIILKEKKNTPGIFLAFMFTSLCGILMFFALRAHIFISLSSSVPFQAIIKKLSPFLGNIYAPVICMALITTGASCLYGFISHMEKRFKKAPLYIILTVATLLFLFFGFKKTVRIIYPLSGIFGVVLIIRILTYKIK